MRAETMEGAWDHSPSSPKIKLSHAKALLLLPFASGFSIIHQHIGGKVGSFSLQFDQIINQPSFYYLIYIFKFLLGSRETKPAT